MRANLPKPALWAYVLLQGLAAMASAQEAPGASPNVILILTDDQGWGATSVLIDPAVRESKSDFVRTPRLEKLAAEGMRFSRAYAPHPNCSPSRASIQSGRSPAALRFTDIFRPSAPELYKGNRLNPPASITELDPDLQTLPELIKAGRPEYTTAHFGKWHLAAGGPEAHGFDASDGDTKNLEGFSKRNLPKDPKRCFSTTTRSIAWMKSQVEAQRPFFLQVSHYAVHLSTQALAETHERVSRWPLGKRHQNRGFAAMSWDLDTAIGQLLDALDELGIASNTWILLTSDNGTYPTRDAGNLNGPLRGTKATIWEGGLRVPLLVRGPGVQPDSTSAEPVIGYDLLPTICEILDIDELPADLEGGSFLSVALGASDAKVERPRSAFCFHWPHYQHDKHVTPSSAWLDLATGDKLHLAWEDGGLQLYNAEVDLDESEDLAPTRAERAAELATQMKAYLSDVEAWLPTPNPDFDPRKDPAKAKSGS